MVYRVIEHLRASIVANDENIGRDPIEMGKNHGSPDLILCQSGDDLYALLKSWEYLHAIPQSGRIWQPFEKAHLAKPGNVPIDSATLESECLSRKRFYVVRVSFYALQNEILNLPLLNSCWLDGHADTSPNRSIHNTDLDHLPPPRRECYAAAHGKANGRNARDDRRPRGMGTISGRNETHCRRQQGRVETP